MAKAVSIRKNGNNRNAQGYDETREIEKLAYQFFAERGYQNGYDQEDWFRSESIVKSRKS